MDLASGFSLSGSAAPKTNVRVKSAPSPTYKRGSDDYDDQRQAMSMQPTSMQRARSWNLNVENSYRIQLAGFKDVNEYLAIHPEPELWENSNFYKCLRAKATGYFMYFRATRECEDKHLNKVKIYTY